VTAANLSQEFESFYGRRSRNQLSPSHCSRRARTDTPHR